MPPDPFAGDPDDPARSMEALDDHGDGAWAGSGAPDVPPLTEKERGEIIADLTDLAVYEELLSRRGIRGIVVDCTDCGEQHFHEWNLLRASLRQLLDEGRMRPHEPAFDPDPADYVTWEYCRGYADATVDAENP
nr:DUF5319 domain-containing protein [Pseudonocardia sp. C8]